MNLNFFHKTSLEKLQSSLSNLVKDKKSRQHALSLISVVFLFFAVFVGIFIGLLQNQEVRKKASGESGNAEIVLVPSTTPLRAETLSTVFVKLNTKGESVDGIQVVFDLFTDVTDSVSIQVKEGTGLRRAWDKVEGIENGKRISFAAITNDPYQPFSSNGPVDVAEITFVAKKTGNLAMVFDGSATKVNAHQQLKDILKPIVIQEYQIASAPTPTPTPKVVVNNTYVAASPTTAKGEEKEEEVVTAKINITSDNNIGGVGYGGAVDNSTKSVCNDSCQYSTECGKDLLCYEGNCRLATNLTSVDCKDVEQRSKECNQDCSQAIECETGLTCFEGKCRVASNPQSITCQSDKDVADNIAISCGNECAINDDCGDNLSCHDGECRLATNPSSPNCSDKEVVVKNLGSGQESTPTPAPSPLAVPDSEGSLSLLTQVVIALALTAVIGIVGIVGYSFIRNRRNSQEL